MKRQDYFYELPKELIAQDPLEDRTASRLLVLDKKTGERTHTMFRKITEYLRPGDCLVLNDTKVIPARLLGRRYLGELNLREYTENETDGAKIELLLLKRLEDDCWETLAKPGKKVRTGDQLVFGDGCLKALVLGVQEDGNRIIKFYYQGIFEEILDKLGQMPLPPYITHVLKDKNRYQTVYAKEEGSAAAPTAGLHFTEELLNELEGKGILIARVTLHVGLGTFRPVKEEDILKHHMHSEFYRILPEAADIINSAKAAGGRVICVGTTSCRTLESAATIEGKIEVGSQNTSIFIYPGYKFKIMDGLITNFHLPESTLLMLVSALAGRKNVIQAYHEAVLQEYRFFSFGDAMLIE